MNDEALMLELSSNKLPALLSASREQFPASRDIPSVHLQEAHTGCMFNLFGPDSLR